MLVECRPAHCKSPRPRHGRHRLTLSANPRSGCDKLRHITNFFPNVAIIMQKKKKNGKKMVMVANCHPQPLHRPADHADSHLAASHHHPPATDRRTHPHPLAPTVPQTATVLLKNQKGCLSPFSPNFGKSRSKSCPASSVGTAYPGFERGRPPPLSPPRRARWPTWRRSPA